MKLLWVKGDFLHPTTKGGQIRTLETLKRLHRRHEVHYIGLHYPPHPEALQRASEYSRFVYPIPHSVPAKYSLGFAREMVRGLYSQWPVSIERYYSEGMRSKIEELVRREHFDCIVCDFLNTSQNIPDLSGCVLFQHNVEAIIWKRQAERAANPATRAYFKLQAQRMRAYETKVCRSVKSIIAVSESDASIMRTEYGATRVNAVATGVDTEYFAPQNIEYMAPQSPEPIVELVFVGSMDWLPNIDGVTWFVREVLPLIRKRRPECRLAVAGRKAPPEITGLAQADPAICVTGTVPDVRPYLWGAAVSIVPLRIGGGTRLKIYESMAAGVPVISTTIGAEGLQIEEGANILIADNAQDFAAGCLELLENQPLARRIAAAGREWVSSRFSWEIVSRQFEQLLFC